MRLSYVGGLPICHAMRVIAVSVVFALACLFAGPASAQTRDVARPPAHFSELKVPAGLGEVMRRRVVIGVDKSMLVELPIDLSNVLVSNPEVVDAVVQTSRQVYLLGKDFGEANAFFLGPGGEKVLFLEISVQRDLSALTEALHRLLPGSKIAVEMVGDNVVLSGSVVDPQDANRAADLAGRFVKKKDAVVNMLTTGAKEQVLLRVKVAEMQRDAIRRIGVDLAGGWLQNGDIFVTEVFKNAFPVTSSLVAAASASQVFELPSVPGGRATQLTWERGQQSVTGLLQMLERTGALRTLAEPNLTAISGETAKFLAGGEFPVPIAQDNNRISVDYKQFGVNVSFKPVVLGEGRISLTISAEVSELSPEASIRLADITLPGLKVRRAETTLELPSGGTLAMAGLLSEDARQSVEGVPGLKELPVLGALFRSNDYQRKETELVILVTPLLVSHQAADKFAKPGDGYMPSSELKELFFGSINRAFGRPTIPDSRLYHGEYGYAVEYPDLGVKG